MAMDALIVQKNKQPEATSRRGWHGNALHSAGASGVRAGLRRRCFIRSACSDTAAAVPVEVVKALKFGLNNLKVEP